MSAEQVGREHYAARRRLIEAAGKLAEQTWQGVDPADLDGSWARLVTRLQLGVAGAQLAAASSADSYVDEALDEQGVAPAADPVLNASALAGVASDGRPLESLLQNSIYVVKAAIGAGAPVNMAMAAGYANLDMLVRTQVADAGRVADQVAIVSRPQITGYVRMLVGKSCSRCVVLAGRRYRWNAGFLRHPRCDCIHVPAAEDDADDIRTSPRGYFDSLAGAEQDKAFTKAGAQAIREGADIGRVVNARRGMYTAGGRRFTTEATTRRGINRRARLMPEQIYAEAKGDRQEALRLLRSHGYLSDGPRIAPRPVARVAAPARIPAPRPAVVTPPPPSPPALKRGVQGKDRLAELTAQSKANPISLADLRARNEKARFDVALAEIGAKQGFDGLPQVVTRAELDAAVASGWTELWRGVQGSYTHTAAAINGRLRSGAYEPGKGLYGNGWYTSERRITAEGYRGREPKTNFPAGGGADFELSDLDGPEEPDSLVRFALGPDARVIDYDELTALRDKWLSGQIGDPALRAYFSDPGRFAASLGYDAIRVPAGRGDGGYYPGWEEEDDPGGAMQIIILNRTAVMVQRAEDAL
jgi:hypothetical protein